MAGFWNDWSTGDKTIESGHVDVGDVVWRWGVDSLGRPYFDDTDGCDVGEEAQLIVSNGVFYAEEVIL